jgi:NAD(P)-dependent dehydrogenase (short-subunit alcohol dehydrogenase family)
MTQGGRPAALVTAGARRIGRAIALNLAQRGFDIAIHYNASKQDAETLAAEIRNLGVASHTVACDFFDFKQVELLIKQVGEVFPALSLLVNNASIFEEGSFLETEPQFYDRNFDIHLKVPFFLSRDFAKHCSAMQNRLGLQLGGQSGSNGHIINIVDSNVVKFSTKHFAYLLSKKALLDFTKMAARELAPAVRVNAIAPGPILPPPGHDDSYMDKSARKVLLKTKGGTQYIVQGLSFLLDNPFVTGECLFIDGGEHIDD